MGFFKSLFGVGNESDKQSKTDDKQRQFDVLKYDGVRALRMGQIDIAVNCLEHAIQLQDDLEVCDYLSQALLHQGRLDEAYQYLQRMAEGESDNQQIYLRMGSVAYMREDYQAEADVANRVLQLNADSPQAHYLLAQAYIGQGNPIVAIAMLTKAVALDDKFLAAYLLRGDTLFKMGDLQGAKADARAVLELAPNEVAGVSGNYTARGTENIQRKVEEAYRNNNPLGLSFCPSHPIYLFYIYMRIFIISSILCLYSYGAMGQGIIRHKVPVQTKREVRKAPTSPKKVPAQRAAVPKMSPQEEARQALIKKLISDMVLVEGGSFTYGGNNSDVDPAANITVGSFYISKYEVTEALWKSVMDTVPRKEARGDNYPATASYADWKKFIGRLNVLSHKQFRFPREEEWEYAMRGGCYSKGYTYSGSNKIYEVAWYRGNSENHFHEVGLLSPNELGLYDMCGNVAEYCQGYEDYLSLNGRNNIASVRGGGYTQDVTAVKTEYSSMLPINYSFDIKTTSSFFHGLRLAMSSSADNENTSAGHRNTRADSPMVQVPLPKLPNDPIDNLPDLQRLQVQKLLDDMVYIEDGSMVYGLDVPLGVAPLRERTIKPFYLCKYEVTEKLWTAIMGSNPCFHIKGDNYPVENIGYTGCKEFISKLNKLTGRHFRLPTKEEWQYAARGGRHSKGYDYSGSDNLYEVAWCSGNSKGAKHEVGQLKPNELGLYDMQGNVGEILERVKGLYADWNVYTDDNFYKNSNASYNFNILDVNLNQGDLKFFDVGFRLAMDL